VESAYLNVDLPGATRFDLPRTGTDRISIQFLVLRVWCLGLAVVEVLVFSVKGVGFGVWGLGLLVEVAGFGVQGLGLRVYGPRFRVHGSWLRFRV